MKQYLIGFLLGVALCMFMGNKIYHPIRGIMTNTKNDPQYENRCMATDIQTLMLNQETIFNLIKDRCGE